MKFGALDVSFRGRASCLFSSVIDLQLKCVKRGLHLLGNPGRLDQTGELVIHIIEVVLFSNTTRLLILLYGGASRTSGIAGTGGGNPN